MGQKRIARVSSLAATRTPIRLVDPPKSELLCPRLFTAEHTTLSAMFLRSKSIAGLARWRAPSLSVFVCACLCLCVSPRSLTLTLMLLQVSQRELLLAASRLCYSQAIAVRAFTAATRPCLSGAASKLAATGLPFAAPFENAEAAGKSKVSSALVTALMPDAMVPIPHA
eukprot:3067128-Rhodomonas_salina.3